MRARRHLPGMLAALLFTTAVEARAATEAAAGEPLLVLLSDTGEERDALPVLAPDPEAGAVVDGLGRGLSGTLLRVYRKLQIALQRREGIRPEPAYVLRSDRQGGFAREGFYLGDEDKSGVGYVDVHRDWPVSGSFGALDQLVPHELAHVIRRQLAGPLADGYANQVHALGVRTDRVVAFNEGFAEHLQAMAIEHPDAAPATADLRHDIERYRSASRRLDAYRREMSARLAFAPRMRLGFVAWYGNDEDVLRYFAVKENAFAREPSLPASVLRAGDPYAAYLLENLLPGRRDGAVKSISRLLASEGVLSSLFYAWANDEGMRASFEDESFYRELGAAPGDVGALENVYLKLFEVFYTHKPQDVVALVAGYRARFPADAAHLEALLDRVLLGRKLPAPAEIWLANPEFSTGTTVFDQFRGLPRVHTFDLNGASIVDLIGVRGVDVDLAREILDAAPFATVDELSEVPGVSAELVARFQELRREMEELRAAAAEESVEEVLSIRSLLLPYARRAAAAVLLAAALGAVLYRVVRSLGAAGRVSWLRTALDGCGAAIVAAVASWAFGGPGLASLAAVALVFGLPAAIVSLRRRRRLPIALNVLAAWLAAALPAVVLTGAWL